MSQTQTLSVDQVAEFLLRNQYLLTSLELYQETVERGQESARLKALFTPQKLDDVAAGEDATAWNNAASFMRPSHGNAGKGTVGSQTSADLANRVSLLEYELRQERQISQELRAELAKTYHSKEALPPNQQTDASAYKKQRQPSTIESRILNYLVKKYLISQGYKLTAISLSSEVRLSLSLLNSQCTSTTQHPLLEKLKQSVLNFFPTHFIAIESSTDEHCVLCVCVCIRRTFSQSLSRFSPLSL